MALAIWEMMARIELKLGKAEQSTYVWMHAPSHSHPDVTFFKQQPYVSGTGSWFMKLETWSCMVIASHRCPIHIETIIFVPELHFDRHHSVELNRIAVCLLPRTHMAHGWDALVSSFSSWGHGWAGYQINPRGRQRWLTDYKVAGKTKIAARWSTPVKSEFVDLAWLRTGKKKLELSLVISKAKTC
jgi:hypothetical protein